MKNAVCVWGGFTRSNDCFCLFGHVFERLVVYFIYSDVFNGHFLKKEGGDLLKGWCAD
ncbi:hypothetical protein CGLO_10682 [Colletotrichum gloeosporioides Cg-14]|uniref:Uncharacterized protein n=1 Tax=Colletotrichum gloeosporioides (strain Cg-14) TaxID=1237896 RepID=T0K374_COLGC|nr:hypothetical protein CGLO_10682 [Colletotrichum gloeosporioides Cg-14]